MPVHTHRLASKVLAGNPLGDPTERDLLVYTPAGWDGSRALPALLAIVGFTGTGAMLFNEDPLGEGLERRMDRLIGSGACPPCVVVAPDCFTRFGGNQYLDSSATGRYETYLMEEVLPFVERTYRVGRWGVFGKSSGGYGAIMLGMRHPEVFAALADHSGDSCFELCYLPDFPAALDEFRAAGGPARWLEKFWADPNRRRMKHMKPLNVLAMGAHYSPNPAAKDTLGVDLPFDLETGEFRPVVWERWREWDPVNCVEKYAEGLRRLRLIFVDCGVRDEFGLHWGARALAAKLRAHVVGTGSVIVHEEFDDGHMNIAYRYDESIPRMVKALQ
jgi:enterochelin esterase family protein